MSLLKCWRGHWRWLCPAHDGYHECPQFCRCCGFNLALAEGRSVNVHVVTNCRCRRSCECWST